MAVLQLTYAKCQEYIALLKGWDRTPGNWSTARKADVQRVVNSGWAKFLRAHQWSFLNVRGSITTEAAYATGTVQVAPDAAGSVVTGTGTTFPTWAADGEFACDDGTYLVKQYNSGTEIILENPGVTIAAGTSYSLTRFRYSLPTDFAALAGPVTFDSPSNNKRYPLHSTHESTIRMKYMARRNSSNDETPGLYAIYAPTHDMTASQQMVFEVFPPAQSQLILRFMYRSQPAAPDDSTNTTFPGGETHGQTILEAVMSEAETILNSASREWEQKFEIGLQRSIEIDKRTATPEYMPDFRNPLSDEYAMNNYDEGVYPFVSQGIVIPEGYGYYF